MKWLWTVGVCALLLVTGAVSAASVSAQTDQDENEASSGLGANVEGEGGGQVAPVVGQTNYRLEFYQNPRRNLELEGGPWGRGQICVRNAAGGNVDRDIVVNLEYRFADDLSDAPEMITIRNGTSQTCFHPNIIEDNVLEPRRDQEVTGSSNDPNVTFSSTDMLYRTTVIADNWSLDSSRRGKINLSTLTPGLAFRCINYKDCRAPVLEEEDGQEIRFRLTMSHEASVDVRLHWLLGKGFSRFMEPDIRLLDDFVVVPPNPIVIPAHTAAGTHFDITFRVADDALDEDLEEFTFQIGAITTSPRLDSVSLTTSHAQLYFQHWSNRQFVIRIGSSDLVDVVADSRVTGLAVEAGDGEGGSTDRAVSVSWSGVSDTTGVHRYVIEAVPAPPSGTDPVWEGTDLVSGSVWGAEVRSGVLSGLVEDTLYAVRVTPSGNRDSNSGLASDWVRVRTGSQPVLGFADDGGGFLGGEGGSVAVEVELDYGLLDLDLDLQEELNEVVRVREILSQLEDPGREEVASNEVRFRVVPFVGEGDTLSEEELPDPVEGMVEEGEMTGSVTLEVADDMLVEGDETFSVRLEPVVAEPEEEDEEPEEPHFSVADPVQVMVTDDDEGPVTVSVAGGFRVGTVDGLVEGGTTDEQWGVFTVSVSEMLGSDLLVDWQLAPGWGVGQLSEVQDTVGNVVPLAGSGVVRIGAGDLSGSVSLRLADDELAEGLGELPVVFSNIRFVDSRVRTGGGFPVGFVGGVSELSGSVVVEASDQETLVIPSGVEGSVSGGEGWHRGDRLGRDTDRMVTVRWSDSEFSDPGRTGFRLEWGVYDSASSSFDPSASESVVVLDPDLRAISLGGLDPGGTYRVEVTEWVGSADGMDVWVENVTTAAAISAGWTDADGIESVSEGGSFGLGVSLSGGGRAVPTDFGFAVVGEGADDLVAADLEQEVQIGAGLVSGSLANQIGVVDDDIVEAHETIAIGMRSGSNFEPGVTFADNYVVTVTDNDVANVSLSVADPVVAEDRVGGFGDPNNFVVELSLDNPVAVPVTVNLSMSGVDASDLVSGLSASVVIPAGELSVEAPVEVADDELTEAAETVMVAVGSIDAVLTGRTNAVVAASGSDSVSVMIAASDVAAPAVSAVTATAGVELGGVVVDSHERIGITWTLPTDVGGVAGYVARFAPVPADSSSPTEDDWRFGGEITDRAATSMAIEKYLGLESGGSYLVEVSARVWGASDFSWVRASQPVMLSATGPVLSLSGPSAPVAESEAAPTTITTNLSVPVSWDVRFSVSTSNVSAHAELDFRLLDSVWVTIPAGQTSATFELVLLDDDRVEGTETLVVGIDTGSVVSGVEVANSSSSVLVTISDDDTAVVSVASPSSGDWLEEDIPMGGTATSISYVFTTENPIAAETMVGWRIVTGAEVTAADFTGDIAGTVTIPAGELTGSAAVIVADDSVAEAAEVVVLEITSVTATLTDRASVVSGSPTDSEATVVLGPSDQTTIPSDQVSNVRIFTGYRRLSVRSEWLFDADINRLSVLFDLPSDTANVARYLIEVALVEENVALADLTWQPASTRTPSFTTSPTTAVPIVKGSWNDLPAFVVGDEYVARVRIEDSDGVFGDWVYSSGLPARADGPLLISLDSASVVNTGIRGESVTVTDALDENGDRYTVEIHMAQSIPTFLTTRVYLALTSENAIQNTEKEGTHDYRYLGGWDNRGRVISMSNNPPYSFNLQFLEDDVADGDKSIDISLTGQYITEENVVIDTDKTITVTILDDETPNPLPVDVGVVAGDADGMRTDRVLSVSWTPPTVPEGLDVSGYVVQYARADSVVTGWSDEIVVDGVASTEVLIVPEGGLEPGRYKVRVRSVVSSREGVFGWVESGEPAVVTGSGGVVAVSFSDDGVVGMEGGLWFGTDCPTVGLSFSEAPTVPVRFGLSNQAGSEISSSGVVGTVPVGVDSWGSQVCIGDDEVVEGEESFDIELSVLSEGAVVGEVGVVPLRVVDDDRSLVSLSSSTLAVVEDVVAGGGAGNEVDLTVGLSKVLSQDVVVGLAFSGDGIGSEDLSSVGAMFSGLEASVRVPAGESSVSLVVEIADDDIAEPTQTLSVEVSGLEFPEGGFGEGVVSVDTDRAVVEVSVASSDGYAVGVSASLSGVQTVVAEDVDGGAESVVSYVVSLDSPVDVEVRVEFELVAASEADAFYPSDVVVSPASPLLIRAGESSGTVEVRVVDDEFQEGAEEFQIRLVSVSGSPTDGTLVEIIQPLGSPVAIAASDSDSATVEPDPNSPTDPGGQGGQNPQPSPPSSGNGGGNGQSQTPTTNPPVDQGGQNPQPTQPTQPPTGGNGQSQNPNTGSPTSPGSQPTGSPTSPGGQPTGGSPTSPGSQPTGSPTSPGVQPNTGGGGVPPGGMAGPSPTGDAASGTTFIDTIGNTHESNIGMLADLGITRGCNPPSNTRFCPDRAVTRGEMATFMVRAFDLAELSENLFGDDDGNTHESNINRLATAEITRGCNPPENSHYCPERAVTRAQMATFIARALSLAEGSGDFTDTADSVHANDINRIATVGITRGCNPPTNSRYCPDRPVTRAEMATFLIRATDINAS